MKLGRNRRKGQAIVEYIIIIVIVAVAALTVMGLFSDRIRTIIAGVASTLEEGILLAGRSIDSGAAERKLELLIEASHGTGA